jgi:putative glutamine amidotransferase
MLPFGVVSNEQYESAEKDSLYDNCDVLLFTGGADLSPALYNKEKLSCTAPYVTRDYYETIAFYKALERGIPMVGICRGMQLFTAMTGGVLVQDIFHPHHHEIHTSDAKVIQTNSLHHQMCLPKEGTYKLLAWAEGLSHKYVGVDPKELVRREDGTILEPEALWFPDHKAFGVQYHPEMMDRNMLAKKYFEEKIEELILCQ